MSKIEIFFKKIMLNASYVYTPQSQVFLTKKGSFLFSPHHQNFWK